ncbi:MAG: ribonuclease III [Pelagibacteraceae bacterium]|jgi:ribonuclease III|nr:ribonuclease III [Pelagibacteraceae bacterium]MBT3902902.1 ribonuclease III [Pelagibacteraceae bacterium]
MISNKNIDKFEKHIGYIFKNKNLLIESLIHPSFIKDNKINKVSTFSNFERLEFLGDRVLGLAISAIIYKKFSNNNEGDLSKRLSYLVQKNFLHKISVDLKMNNILKYTFKKNEKMNISILADSIESLIGAIYLDGGFLNAKKFIKKIWGPYFDIKDQNIQDSKTKLQEISQQKLKKLPDYELIKKEGPSHSPLFTVSLKVLNLKKIKANGGSIREAEKNAAKIALQLLDAK